MNFDKESKSGKKYFWLEEGEVGGGGGGLNVVDKGASSAEK